MAEAAAQEICGLFESSVPLSHLMEGISLPVVVTDRCGGIRFFNSAFELLVGYDLATVQGVRCCYVLRSNFCQGACLRDRVTETAAPVHMEGNVIDQDHQKVDARLTISPIFDDGDQIVGFVETVEDRNAMTSADDLERSKAGFDQIIGRSAEMQKVFSLIPVVAQTDSSLLITGETGTGKDMLARVIHDASDRSDKAFVKINCGALPENLLESELFGHKKGAFTGATADKMGRLRLAHDGTLYLTEIGDLPLPLQVKLLTFLDDQVVYPLGGTSGFQANVRVIAATHRNLERMVEAGLFRQDLLYRLNVVRLRMPPVRERDGDISLLLAHFLAIFSARFDKRLKGFHPSAMDRLLEYPYPGNVRELRNIVEYAASICMGEKIDLEHLPAYLDEKREFMESRAYEAESPAFSGELGPVKGDTHSRDWATIERQIIVDALVKAKGRKNQAAELLGWGRTTLWRKMKQHGLE